MPCALGGEVFGGGGGEGPAIEGRVLDLGHEAVRQEGRAARRHRPIGPGPERKLNARMHPRISHRIRHFRLPVGRCVCKGRVLPAPRLEAVAEDLREDGQHAAGAVVAEEGVAVRRVLRVGVPFQVAGQRAHLVGGEVQRLFEQGPTAERVLGDEVCEGLGGEPVIEVAAQKAGVKPGAEGEGPVVVRHVVRRGRSGVGDADGRVAPGGPKLLPGRAGQEADGGGVGKRRRRGPYRVRCGRRRQGARHGEEEGEEPVDGAAEGFAGGTEEPHVAEAAVGGRLEADFEVAACHADPAPGGASAPGIVGEGRGGGAGAAGPRLRLDPPLEGAHREFLAVRGTDEVDVRAGGGVGGVVADGGAEGGDVQGGEGRRRREEFDVVRGARVRAGRLRAV